MNEHENENEVESELIGGKNPIVEALRSGRELNKIWVAEGLNMKSIGEILSLGKKSRNYRAGGAETKIGWLA